MDVVKELSVERDIVEVLQIRRLTYLGHITCMKHDRFPHVLLRGYYTHAHRFRGRRKKRSLDNIRRN